MLVHRFLRPSIADREQLEFLKELRKGTFRGLCDSFVGKLLCFIRIHEANLEGDEAGFYRVCDRCGYYEPTTFWSEQSRSREPPQLNK